MNTNVPHGLNIILHGRRCGATTYLCSKAAEYSEYGNCLFIKQNETNERIAYNINHFLMDCQPTHKILTINSGNVNRIIERVYQSNAKFVFIDDIDLFAYNTANNKDKITDIAKQKHILLETLKMICNTENDSCQAVFVTLSQCNDMNVGMNIPRTIHYLADEVIELQKPLYNEETGYTGIAVVDKSRTRDKGTTEEFDLDMNPVVPEPCIDKK